jgi:hypothetical protein
VDFIYKILLQTTVYHADSVCEPPVGPKSQSPCNASAKICIRMLSDYDSRDAGQARRDTQLVVRDKVMDMNGVHAKRAQSLDKVPVQTIPLKDPMCRKPKVNHRDSEVIATIPEGAVHPVDRRAHDLGAGLREPVR